MAKDLYPNYSLEEIIEGMETSDKKRLALQNYPTDGVIVRADLPYLDDGDDFHKFDIYYNEERKGDPIPTIINIHGGGLVYGTKELDKNMNVDFAREGFNVLGLNYRLIPRVNLREQISDIISALNFIFRNHNDLGLSLEKTFISADSAGCYLAMAAFAVINSPKLQDLFDLKGPEIKINGMVFISPMTKLEEEGSISTINDLVVNALDKKEQKAYAKNMIPILYEVEVCPILIQTSSEDFIRDHSYDLRNYLDKRGAFYEFIDFGKGRDYELGHVFPVCYPKYPESLMAIEQIVLFLKNI